MASSTSKACSSGLMILLLLQIIASGVLAVGGLTVTVENEMVTIGQKMDLHCHLNGKDLGQLSLMPFNRFAKTFTTSFLGRDIFTCTFATAGKPTTTIDVFKGFSFKTRPCACLGTDHCFWQALNEGFWCNSNFIQKWG